MNAQEIIRQRLLNQRIATTTFTKPEQVVDYLGAVQAQEYAVSKWSIGLRAIGLVDNDVEKSINDGRILRTHALRPTWHFVTPQNIRWMLMLNKPRVMAGMKARWKQLELTDKIAAKSNQIITKALQGNKQLTRTEIKTLLDKQKIQTDENRLSHLLMVAELDALICSGPRVGKHFTYMLLDERVASTKPLEHDEAVNKLAEIYFTSRGPATIHDFAWWSGLTMSDIRNAIDALPKKFERETIDNKEYIFLPTKALIKEAHRTTFLMPDYDEYGISYKDRSAINPHEIQALNENGRWEFMRVVIVDGVTVGGWKRVETKNGIDVELNLKAKLTKAQQQSLQNAIARFKNFVNNVT